ncbi:hypothetical protein GCM10009794_21490 [Rothia terrae]
MPRREMFSASQYSRRGRKTLSTRCGSTAIGGRCGMKETRAPTAISTRGAMSLNFSAMVLPIMMAAPITIRISTTSVLGVCEEDRRKAGNHRATGFGVDN